MKGLSLEPFGVEKPTKKAAMFFNVCCKIRINNMLLPILAMCLLTLFAIKMSTMPAPQNMRKEVIQHKFAPVSTAATQLVDLQDQLSTRMAQHHDIMSTNLDEFTTILTNVTEMADQSLTHLNFLANLLVVGIGGSNPDWTQMATLLTVAEEKLRNYSLDDDLLLKLGALTQNAEVMVTELKDMELFMQDIESKVSILMDSLARALHEDEVDQVGFPLPQTTSTADNEPQHSFFRVPFFGRTLFNAYTSERPASQPLFWAWDVIVDGHVHSTFGEFTEIQKILIQRFLATQNTTLSLPTTLPYDIGLPDTLLPQDFPSGPVLIISSSDSAFFGGSRYSCDITAHFRDLPVPVKEGWWGLLKWGKGERMERELIGVQSVICWEGEVVEAKKDVVREWI